MIHSRGFFFVRFSLTKYYLAAGILLGALFALPVHAANSDGVLPDQALTPGAVRTTDKTEICTTKTSDVRNVPGSLKEAVRRRYGMTSKRDLWCNTQEACEIDHLVPLAVGGSNEITNLWPQPYEGQWNAHHKDQLEAKMKRLLCAGKVTVEEAQSIFKNNWVEGYKKFIATEPKSSKYPASSED